MVWSSEALHSELKISFSRDYEGEGVSCGMDACWFTKNRTDGKIAFYISVWGMTGGLPEHFSELPAEYIYPHTEFMTTRSGLEAAFYSEINEKQGLGQCRGTFVVEANDGSGYVEAVRVTFSSASRLDVKEVLRRIEY